MAPLICLVTSFLIFFGVGFFVPYFGQDRRETEETFTLTGSCELAKSSWPLPDGNEETSRSSLHWGRK
jgi:hypothetical protein